MANAVEYEPTTYDVLYHSGLLNVAASACGGIAVPILDGIMGPTTKWHLMFIFSLFPKSPGAQLTLKVLIISTETSLFRYFASWHLLLFVRPMLAKAFRKGTDDEFLNSLGIAERQVQVFFLPKLVTWAVLTCWTARMPIVSAAALLFGAWVLCPSLARQRILHLFLRGVIAGLQLVMRGDFSIRALLLRMHDLLTIPLNRWEISMARRKRRPSVAPPGNFFYRPLESARHIRLLKLKRSSWFHLPSCELVHTSLDDDGTPTYEAISYTWGQKAPSIPLDVDGQQLLVTAAVDDLLFHRRSMFTCTYLWIDAVCINQSSTEEKDVQLPLMKEIYERAGRTIVWLDEPQSAREAHITRKLIRGASIFPLLGKDSELYMSLLFKNNETAFYTVGHLFSHPWFQRIWILQEIAASKEVHVMWRGTCLDWFTIVRFIERTSSDAYLKRNMQYHLSPKASSTLHDDSNIGLEMKFNSAGDLRAGNVAVMARARHHVQTSNPLTLGQLIMSTRIFTSTDPRDRVFALIGIASDGLALPFKPEYGRPVADTFIDTATFLLSQGRWSIALSFAGRGYDSLLEGTRSSLADALPSWVPDYSSGELMGIRTPHKSLLERIDVTGSITFTADRRAIMLQAATICSIKHLGPTMKPLKGSLLQVNPEAIDFDGQLFRWLFNANHRPRQWYEEALRLVFAFSRIGRVSEEAARQCLWELCMDANIGQEKAEEEGGELLYPLHSGHARKIFDTFLLSSPHELVHMTGQAATGENVSTKQWVAMLTSLIQTFAFCVAGRRLGVTDSGLIALLPPFANVGDVVVHIRGSWTPHLFRRKLFQSRVAELVGTCTLESEADRCPQDVNWDEWILK